MHHAIGSWSLSLAPFVKGFSMEKDFPSIKHGVENQILSPFEDPLWVDYRIWFLEKIK